jgi:hypothetical protein
LQPRFLIAVATQHYQAPKESVFILNAEHSMPPMHWIFAPAQYPAGSGGAWKILFQ